VPPAAADAAKYFMLDALTQDPAFRDVPVGVVRALVEGVAVGVAAKGDVVYEAGQRWDRLGFVVEGSIAMFAGTEAKEHLYERAGPGEFFGVSAMFDGDAEMARTVVVSRRFVAAYAQRDVVLAACREHGSLAIAFATTIARRVRRTTALLADQLNLTATERIARYLLGFAVGPGRTEARDPLPLMTQAQIGAAAGTVKDVAARTIGAFEQQGALERERGHVRWLHRERLRALGRVES
jgi:CRP-like cAMP-binding protein